MTGWLVGVAFITCCLAFVAVLVLGDVRYQAARADRFDVFEEDGDE